MELRLLRYFIAVAEELHLARAAERLGIEQSPVSRAMRDLERLLDVQLFDRRSRRTRLTSGAHGAWLPRWTARERRSGDGAPVVKENS